MKYHLSRTKDTTVKYSNTRFSFEEHDAVYIGCFCDCVVSSVLPGLQVVFLVNIKFCSNTVHHI